MKKKLKVTIVIFLITALLVPVFIQPVYGRTSPLWDREFDRDIDWIIQTEFDVLIAGSNKKLYALSERRGEEIWSIKSGPDINRNDVTVIDGTDILLVNREIEKDRSYKLEAYELLTGKKLWENNKIKGKGIEILPVLERWAFLYLTDSDSSDRVRPHIYNMNIFKGKINWESEFDSSFNGTKSSGVLIFGNKYDVSGFYPPVFIDDEIYFFYDGIRKFSYKTGKQLWYSTYTVNKDETFIKSDGDAIITDKTIYTSGAGIIRAINRKDGSVIWASEDFGVVPLMYYDGGKIFGQIGGTFIKANFDDIKNIAPVGVLALDAKTGNTDWKFYNCQEPVTNIVPVKDKILFSDKRSLIAVDKKTGKDIYKTTLDFENPVITVAYEKEKKVLVQSGQKIGCYDLKSGHKTWVTGFKEQKPGFLDKLPNRLLIGTALIVFTGGLATPILLGSYIAYDINRSMNRNAAEDRLYRQAQAEKTFWAGANAFRNSPGFSQAVKIRKERMKLLTGKKDIYFYVYGEDEHNSNIQGAGAIDIEKGSMKEIDLDDDKPAYFYDRIYNLLFYTDGDKISAYRL
ncbi:MAG: PQQ-binding-like beta-propeller repeat protein [Candidatus Eremiobacterota bacterium]